MKVMSDNRAEADLGRRGVQQALLLHRKVSSRTRRRGRLTKRPHAQALRLEVVPQGVDGALVPVAARGARRKAGDRISRCEEHLTVHVEPSLAANSNQTLRVAVHLEENKACGVYTSKGWAEEAQKQESR
jgi:hypothetical protein